MKMKSQRAVTLTVLVITIVVMLIIAGASASMLFDGKGLLRSSAESKRLQENYSNSEEIKTNKLIGDVTNIMNEKLAESEKTPITKDKTYVGCYADMDDNGTVDGIIYADLAIGRSGAWNDNSWSVYSYHAVTSGLKDYYVKQKDYLGTFGTDDKSKTRDVIAPVSKDATGKDRFYVMSLNDFTTSDNTKFCWYASAYPDADLTLSDGYVPEDMVDFGMGKPITERMMEEWEAEIYGKQNGNSSYPDMWGVIQAKMYEGWFVPSKSEWSAFGDAFKITSTNYDNLGLSDYYWSSPVNLATFAFRANFSRGYIGRDRVDNGLSVRLSATF